MNTLEEIISSFITKCDEFNSCCNNGHSSACKTCDYSHINDFRMCELRYIYDVATGARDIAKPLTNIPAWFFKGAKVWNVASACWQTIEDYQVNAKDGTLNVDFVCLCGGEECGHSETAYNVRLWDFAEKNPFPDGTKPLQRVYNHTTRTIDTISYLSQDKDGTLSINGGPVSNYDLIPDWVKVGQKILFRDGRIQKISEIGDSKIMLESGDFILTEDICNSEELGFEPINLPNEEISQKEKGNTMRKLPSLQLIRDIYETYQMACYDSQPEYDEFIHDIMSGADDITKYPLFRVYFKAFMCTPLGGEAFIEEDILINETSWDVDAPSLEDFIGGEPSSSKVATIRDYVDEWLDRVTDEWDGKSPLNAYDRSWFECDFGCSHEISFSFQIDKIN